MAAQLQIFRTNPASHTDCKGMWNLCVNLAVVVSRLAIGKSFLGKVVRFFYSLTLRRMGRRAPFYEGYLFFLWGEISKKQLPTSLHYRSCQAFVEKMFVFLWKVKALTPVAQILVPRQSSIFWKKEKTLSNLQPSVTSWLSNSYITWEGKVGPSGNC